MIEINHLVYNHLARELIKHRKRDSGDNSDPHRYPFLYLIGSKKINSIINTVIKLKENGGDGDHCHRMSHLGSKEFSKKAIELMKKGYVIRGLVRVGDFKRGWDNHDDGHVESELYEMNPKMLFVTVQPSDINIKHVRSNSTDFKIIKSR